MARWGLLRAALAVGGALTVGCQFPTPADRPPDAAIDAPTDAPVDARPDVVMGTVSVGYRTEAGVEERFTDLSTVTIEALLPDASEPSGYRSVVGVSGADGRFTIEGVPPDVDYLLKVGTRYYQTRAHQIVLRSEVPVRPDVATVTMPTIVTFDEQPTVGGRQLFGTTIASFSTGAQGAPSFAAPSDFRLEMDWSLQAFATYGPADTAPLPSATDDLWIVNYRSGLLGTAATMTITSALKFDDATIVDGVDRAIAGIGEVPAASAPPTSVSINRDQLDPAYDDPTAVAEFSQRLDAIPTLAARWVTNQPLEPVAPIFTLVCGTDCRSRVVSGLMPGAPDPFPSSWPRVVTQRYWRRATYRFGGSLIRLTAGMNRMFVPPVIGAGPPVVSPPTAISIEGRAGRDGGGVRITGAAITVAWNGSALARQYHVDVYRLTRSGPRLNGSVLTTNLAVDVPAALFTGSDYFAFAVTAFSGTNDYRAGVFVPSGIPGTTATALTNAFRVSSTCGDGAIDVGETCDASGAETAACDLDCTAPTCGDGIRNATAGEPCDTIVDTQLCDGDCTPVECGDGHLNTSAEQCDDGNAAADGNGCGADCRFNNVCGDGVVQVLAEDCDAHGETGACDRDCTLASCGDRYINAAAGEQCDDGGQQSGDGCSASCQLE